MNKMSSAIIAMSGGVDSSVAAAICKEKYRKVIGCTLKLFEAESTDIAINDAAEVSKKLGIDHIVVDSKDNQGMTPLAYAEQSQNKETIGLFLHHVD